MTKGLRTTLFSRLRLGCLRSTVSLTICVVLQLGQSGCSRSVEAIMQAKVLQSGTPIANALVVLTQSKRPFMGSLFSSADPSRCIALGFARTDAAGNFTRIQGTFPNAIIAPGFVGLSELGIIGDQGGFVLRQQRLQSSEEAEQFGPEYATEAEANRDRLAFLASAEGKNYTAFTVQPPDSGFKNFRTLVVKYIEVARSEQHFKTEAEANKALQGSAYAIRGNLDADAVLEVLAHCQSVKPTQPELGIAVLRALELELPPAKRTVRQVDYMRQFTKQLGAAPAPAKASPVQ